VHNASGPEKRQHKRFLKSCEVEFCANNKKYKGVSDNFSIDGLFIETNILLAPHSVVSIIVHLPDGSVSKLKGRVRRVAETCNDTPMEASQQTFKSGIGIEIIERDSNYFKFFMLLLSSIKF
jgi:hypothetical protein